MRVASRRALGPAGENIGRQMVLSVHGTVNGLVLVGLVEGAILGVVYFVVGVPHATIFGLSDRAPGHGALRRDGGVRGGRGGWLLAVNKIVGAVVVIVVGGAVTFVGRPLRPACADRRGHAPAVPLGAAEHTGRAGGAWGLVGLFLGPAILAALILLWREWVGSQQGPINPSVAVVDATLPGAARIAAD